MSVLVKNMKLPKCCAKCFIPAWSCKKWKDVKNTRTARHPDCPLAEVPTPHGRLIDADALVWDECEYDDGTPVLLIDKQTVDEAPAIIEAEE